MSINIADQEALDLALPLARKHGMGPVANGVWRSKQRPELYQNQPYWERLQSLRYDFLQGEHDFATALKFTLSVPGVHTAIVGTTDPAHLRQNAEYVEAGLLNEAQLNAIRAEWKRAARPDWVGQT
jgi:aryl-alcohol dehydrogenase-like predicted oxidoreductase